MEYLKCHLDDETIWDLSDNSSNEDDEMDVDDSVLVHQVERAMNELHYHDMELGRVCALLWVEQQDEEGSRHRHPCGGDKKLDN